MNIAKQVIILIDYNYPNYLKVGEKELANTITTK